MSATFTSSSLLTMQMTTDVMLMLISIMMIMPMMDVKATKNGFMEQWIRKLNKFNIYYKQFSFGGRRKKVVAIVMEVPNNTLELAAEAMKLQKQVESLARRLDAFQSAHQFGRRISESHPPDDCTRTR